MDVLMAPSVVPSRRANSTSGTESTSPLKDGHQDLVQLEEAERVDADDVANVAVVLAHVDMVYPRQLCEWPRCPSVILVSNHHVLLGLIGVVCFSAWRSLFSGGEPLSPSDRA